jgi:3'-phosphoadenosine 5'-phosphosulfate sulfotransferase (PAPS reductase)/FAD synthetase
MAADSPRHILSLSGGKDSTALAIYMRDRVAGMEYVFCDTDKELPETYEYLDKLEAYLNQPIVRLRHGTKGFDDLLAARNGFLPSSQMRWCTQYLKIEPFERYVGDDAARTYIGIRADEHRQGYISTKPNLIPIYPFKEDGIDKAGVARILEESGLGFPDYYKWRSRSGCYFCFYQQRQEWVGLLENHPDLYERAQQYEKIDASSGERYTWTQRESLEDLRRPERIAQIKEEAAKRVAKARMPLRLVEMFADADEDDSCLICHL